MNLCGCGPSWVHPIEGTREVAKLRTSFANTRATEQRHHLHIANSGSRAGKAGRSKRESCRPSIVLPAWPEVRDLTVSRG